MIARTWSGRATTEKADKYLVHLEHEVFPRLRRIDGHAGWANTRAMEMAGITRTFKGELETWSYEPLAETARVAGEVNRRWRAARGVYSPDAIS